MQALSRKGRTDTPAATPLRIPEFVLLLSHPAGERSIAGAHNPGNYPSEHGRHRPPAPLLSNPEGACFAGNAAPRFALPTGLHSSGLAAMPPVQIREGPPPADGSQTHGVSLHHHCRASRRFSSRFRWCSLSLRASRSPGRRLSAPCSGLWTPCPALRRCSRSTAPCPGIRRARSTKRRPPT